MKDLKVLESGVKVYHPVAREVKSGVIIHPADNLEAHTVGGFSQSFSSKDICRQGFQSCIYARPPIVFVFEIYCLEKR